MPDDEQTGSIDTFSDDGMDIPEYVELLAYSIALPVLHL